MVVRHMAGLVFRVVPGLKPLLAFVSAAVAGGMAGAVLSLWLSREGMLVAGGALAGAVLADCVLTAARAREADRLRELAGAVAAGKVVLLEAARRTRRRRDWSAGP